MNDDQPLPAPETPAPVPEREPPLTMPAPEPRGNLPGPEPPLSLEPNPRAAVPEREPFWHYSDLLLFAGLLIPSLLLGMGLVKLASFVLRIQKPNRTAEQLAIEFVAYILLFGSLMLILRIGYGRPFWRSLGWVGPGLPYLWIVLPGLATALTVAILAYVIGTPTTSNPMMELLKDRLSVILVATFGVTMGPICEELAFRGFLQPLLVRSFGVPLGVLFQAIPFGLLHFQQYGNSWKHALVISMAGAAFGAMRQATGSTKASAVMHASYNALFFVGLLAQGKNMQSESIRGGLTAVNEALSSRDTMTPTISLAMTQAGVIMGTAAYMSPEQAAGKAVDKRVYIWSFD